MKAVILAAGKAERLGNLLGEIPKPMIRIFGKPVLEHTINLCRKYGITDIFINVHHLRNVIMDYFEEGSRWDVNISYLVEKTLHGTSGSVRKIAEKFWGFNSIPLKNRVPVSGVLIPEPFFVLYGDNFSNYDLGSLMSKSSQTDAMVTIAFHHREDVSTSGVAEFGDDMKVLSFIEKPNPGETNSHWVNAGIYFMKPEILNFIPEGFSDFARDIFPLLLRQKVPIFGVCNTSEVIAFDTPEMFNKNVK